MNTLNFPIMVTNCTGQRIKQARIAAGLTQKQLAKAAGVSRPAVGQWESGDIKKIGAATLVNAAAAMRVSVDWLLCRDVKDQGRETPPAIHVDNHITQELSDYWLQLTSAQQRELTSKAAEMAAANALVLAELTSPPR